MAIPDPAAPAKTLGLQNISFSSNVMFSFRLRKGFRKYDLGVYDGYIRISGYEEMPFYRRGEPIPNAPTFYTTPGFGDEFDDSYYLDGMNKKFKGCNNSFKCNRKGIIFKD